MFYRRYRDQEISVVGFGGICVMNETDREADRIVGRAVDRGVNYFDVAPSYGDAQDRLGPALERYRKDAFLACKTNRRDGDGAAEELHASLKALRTDYLDLYQIHGIQTDAEVDQVLAPGGALEVFRDAVRKGEVRYIGFSAHNEDAALRLLEAAAFDSVLFPVNRFVWHAGKVGPRILDAAAAAGSHVLALKALALRRWRDSEERTWSKTWYKPVDSPDEARAGIRFTLSRPVVAAVSPGHEELLHWACDAADSFEPLSPEEELTFAAESAAGSAIFDRAVGAI